MPNPNEYNDEQFVQAGTRMRESGLAHDIQSLWEAGAREPDIADEIKATLDYVTEMEEVEGIDVEEIRRSL